MFKYEKNYYSSGPIHQFLVDSVATAYNRAGEDYAAYADGEGEDLFSFHGLYAYADRCVWEAIDGKLRELKAAGATSVSILDAGCGPGTWLRRVVTHARELGFTQIRARGFDLAEIQIRTACRKAQELAGLPGVSLTFDVGDLERPLPEADGSVDIGLCLYSVLNHLPVAHLPRIAREFARVTRGCFITTVRSTGSMPTINVDSMEKARHVKLNHKLDRCDVEFADGHRLAMNYHLFSSSELRSCFASRFDIEDLRGIDIFHNRFSPDRRWNPDDLAIDPQLEESLALLESRYARDVHFMERANHLLLVARPRHNRAADYRARNE